MSIGLLVNYKKCGIGNGFAVGELSNDKYSVLTDKPNKNNSTGFRGVAPYQQSGRTKYKASLVYKGIDYHKKGFQTAEEAREYRKYLEKKYLPKK